MKLKIIVPNCYRKSAASDYSTVHIPKINCTHPQACTVTVKILMLRSLDLANLVLTDRQWQMDTTDNITICTHARLCLELY